MIRAFTRTPVGYDSVHYATDYGVIPDGVTDNAIALQAAADSFAGNKGRLILPPGIICTSAQIESSSANFASAILIEGAEKSATTIKAIQGATSWAGKAVFYRGNTSTVIGGGLCHMTIDANLIADYGIYYRTGKQTIMESLNVISATVTTGLYGDPAVGRFYETKFIDCSYSTSGSFDPTLRPTYNMRLQGFATDNEIFRCTAANAKNANIRVEPGGNTIIACHAYGFPDTHEATYCYDLAAERMSVVDCVSDGFTTAGIHIAGDDSAVVACRFFWPTTVTADAILLAANRTDICISNNTYYNMPANKAEVAFAGAQPANSYIQSGLIKTDGTRFFLGYTQSLSTLINARFQIAGTDFQGSAYGQGRWSADASGPFLAGYKSRGATVGANGLVSASDQLFIIDGMGDDGATQRAAVRLLMRADGTPAAGVMPGQIDIQTATVGTATLASRMRLDSRGNVIVAPGATALATNVVDGYFYVQPTNGVPTGVPRFGDGALAMDKNTGKLYCYSTVIAGWVAQS